MDIFLLLHIDVNYIIDLYIDTDIMFKLKLCSCKNLNEIRSDIQDLYHKKKIGTMEY